MRNRIENAITQISFDIAIKGIIVCSFLLGLCIGFLFTHS